MRGCACMHICILAKNTDIYLVTMFEYESPTDGNKFKWIFHGRTA